MLSLITPDEFEDTIFAMTKRFTKHTPASNYQEVSDDVLGAFKNGDTGIVLAMGVWMWRDWKFSEGRPRFRSFRRYVLWRLQVYEERVRLHKTKYSPVIETAYRGLIAIYGPIKTKKDSVAVAA